RRAAEGDGRPRDDKIRADRQPGKPTGWRERGGRGSSGGSGGGSGGDDDEEGAYEKGETGRGDAEQAGAMTHSIDRLGVMRSLILAAVALLLAACSLEYLASVPQVEAEVMVLTIVLVNYQNRVDVIPGLPAYDQTHPEMAVAPQRFALVFDSPEYVVAQERGLVAQVLGADPPALTLDYTRFLRLASLLPGLSL